MNGWAWLAFLVAGLLFAGGLRLLWPTFDANDEIEFPE